MIRTRALAIFVAATLVGAATTPAAGTDGTPVGAPASPVPVMAGAAGSPPAPPRVRLDAGSAQRLRQQLASDGNPKAASAIAAVLQSDQAHGAAAALTRARALGLAVSRNKVRVVIEASDAGAALPAVAASGAEIERTAGNLIQVLATPGQLQALLRDQAVRYVRPPSPHVEDAVTDEAVTTTNASTWQQRGQSGAGVKIAIIDGGFAGYPSAQASGDLPASLTAVDVCEGNLTSATDHGTAVAEIVHKMAPAAQLYLICIGTDVDLATAAEYAKDNGITIVNNSQSWYNTSRGDGSGGPGTPDAIVKDARASGILWVSSAGNAAESHWSGTFHDDGFGFNLFAANNEFNGFYLPAGETQCVALKWDDWPVSAQDYDLALADADVNLVAVSINAQDGSEDPTEGTCYTNLTGVSQWFFVMIFKHSATKTPRFDLFMLGSTPLQYQVAAGSVTEPASSPSALGVGAACWSGTTIEAYSSRGPTIDNRIKPDLTGPDQVSTATYGGSGACADFLGFAGTSASAAHVAGAAALVKGAFPSYTVPQIQAYLQAQAQDQGSAGKDNVYGSGLLRLPTVALVPGAPTGVHGVGYDRSAAISWTAPANDGGGAITGYAVTSAPGGLTCTTSGALTCTVSGLTNGTPYSFTVSAANAAGTGPASDASSMITPIPVPDAPTGVLAARDDTRAPISWTAPADNGSPITGYTVTSSPEGKTCTTTGAVSCTVTGLTNGQAYTFTATATNAIGTGPASGASNSVTPAGLPSAPTGSAATPGNHAALIAWTAADDNGAAVTGYAVTSSPGGLTCTTTGELSCVVAGLDNGTPYTFTVIATNVVGPGPASTPTAAVTPVPVPDPPSSVLAIASDATALVSWEAPGSDGGSPITGYTVTSSPGGLTCTTTGELSCTVSGLTNRTLYAFSVTATNSTGTGLPSAPSVAVTPLFGATYVTVSPVRLLSTLGGVGLGGPFVSGTPRTFAVAGVMGIPANAIAITANLTVTRQTSAGYVALGPLATASPGTSTLNFPRGDNRANGLTVPLSATGTLSAVFKGASGATTALILDVTGYYLPDASGATYVTVSPVRLLSTLGGVGLGGPFVSGTPRTFAVAGVMGIPANAIAITANLTVTRQTSAGYVALGPLATASPGTSTLNFPRGDNRANGLTVPLSATGTLSAVFKGASGATTALILDVTGYYLPDASGATYVTVSPVRLLSTLGGVGLGGPFVSGTPRTFAVAGVMGIPANAIAITANLTVTSQTSAGYVALGPLATASPGTSTLNFPRGDNRANGLTVPLSATGTLSAVFKGASGATTALILDVTGYYLP